MKHLIQLIKGPIQGIGYHAFNLFRRNIIGLFVKPFQQFNDGWFRIIERAVNLSGSVFFQHLVHLGPEFI